MTNTARFAQISALAGDPAQAAILHGLLDGRALTAGELANLAGVTPQTASGHLGQLRDGGLVSAVAQGRHRYYRLRGPEVAQMLEAIMTVAAQPLALDRKLSTGPKDKKLRLARTCYDHLAGRLAVALADALISREHIELTEEAALLTPDGAHFLERMGLDLPSASASSGRVLCRACLDWSERRPHIAGFVGARLCMHSLEKGWLRRIGGTRAVEITPLGQTAFRDIFGIRLDSSEV